MMDIANANIESLTSSLVREYLSRKGCRNTLAELDKEFPRPKNSISNRLQLIHALSIEPWVKENRKNGNQYKTLVEIVVFQTMLHSSAGASGQNLYSDDNEHYARKNASSSQRNDSHSKQTPSFIQRNDANQYKDDYHTQQNINGRRKTEPFTNSAESFHTVKNGTNLKDSSSSSTLTLSLDLSTTTTTDVEEEVKTTKKYKTLNPEFSIQQHTVKKSTSDYFKSSPSIVPCTSKTPATRLSQRKPSDLALEDFIDGGNNKRSTFKSNTMDSPPVDHKSTMLKESTIDKSKDDQINFKDFLDFLTDEGNDSEFQNKPKSRTEPTPKKSSSVNLMPTLEKASADKQKTILLHLKDVVGDITFDAETAMKVRQLIFGSERRGFASEWTDQGFTFNDCKNGEPTFLRIGLVQKKGGPCGILSAVQALVLKNYLFSEDSNEETLFDEVPSYKRTEALENTLVEIIWKSRVKQEKVYLAVLTMGKQFSPPPNYRPDGITEHVKLIPCSTHKELKIAVHEHVKEFEKGKGSCILLLYSLILTHGIDQIKGEMDEDGGRLLGLHAYCTQEMINLVLQGEAYSNAFNDSIRLGKDTLLRGISHQSDIGMLSLFEHYDSVKIGEYYKSPKYPIWLICSESHFTVLFSLNRKINGRQFDLYYYDGLANQDEVIKLTINQDKLFPESKLTGSLVPPINHCIHTKWPKVFIDWNDTDPIL